MGAPHKGSKVIWTDKLEKRYAICESKPVIINILPRRWVPEVILMDTMFLIQCNLLRQTMTVMDYAKLFLNRFVIQHFHARANQVHVLFDFPSHQKSASKTVGQQLQKCNHEHKISTIHQSSKGMEIIYRM